MTGSWGLTWGAAFLWLLSDKSGLGWCVSSGLPIYAVASGTAAGAGLGAVVTRQSTEALEVFRPSGCSMRCSHFEISAFFLLASYFAVLCLVFGCCFWSAGSSFLWEMLWGAMFGMTVEKSSV